jgi:hypothetical protein
MKTFYKPSEAIKWSKERLYNHGYVVKTERWQGVPSPDDMWEVMNHSFQMFIPKDIESLIEEVNPNLPWADDHFDERIGGVPLNPPPSNEWWPYNRKKNEQFKKDEMFSHTYPERIWPKKAPINNQTGKVRKKSLQGIRFEYGDMSDLIDMLEREPFTRQAFLPIWFPEDTGAPHKERVPCTIGYHFMRRGDRFHISYFIRSCDIIRHFRDDIYLACRKLYWILDSLKKRDPETWGEVEPGYYSMHIISLHCFNREKGILKQSNI